MVHFSTMLNANKKTPQDTVTTWVDMLVDKAIKLRASDIHLEPRRDGFVILFRIDGMIHTIETLRPHQHKAINSRIKVMANLDITVVNIPQDGQFEHTKESSRISLRVSTYPTIYGEALVLRILNRSASLLKMESLGLDEKQLKILKEMIQYPHGMIMITGPSGSGKTTLLYSIINLLNTGDKNIITVEDPVEQRMDGVRQGQMSQAKKFDFVTAVRSILRQDPDIIMVGEIRDKETARISSQAALTGSLVLSTFHTLDIFAVITRLLEMGVPRSIIGHAINGVITTRLVRKICTSCQIPYKPTSEEMKMIGAHDMSKARFLTGEGCHKCRGGGYYGRIGLFEILAFDKEIRSLITEQDIISETFYSFERTKAKGLGESGLDKVFAGITTIEEVLRVTGKLS